MTQWKPWNQSQRRGGPPPRRYGSSAQRREPQPSASSRRVRALVNGVWQWVWAEVEQQAQQFVRRYRRW